MLIVVGLFALASAADAGLEKNRKIGWGPRTSKAAAKMVKRSNWEPRHGNRASNRRVHSRKNVRSWRRRSDGQACECGEMSCGIREVHDGGL
jgi:hypothetical protein